MTHALPASRFHDIDTGRVLAQAGAIALNVALLMALMTPIRAPLQVAERREVIEVTTIEKKRDEPRIEKVEVKRETRPVPVPVRPEPRPAPKSEDPPVIFEHAEATDTQAPPDTGNVVPDRSGDGIVDTIEPPQVETGATLRYAIAPPPPYPRDAMRDGASGTVLLEVLVDVDGRPLEVKIAHSSGHRGLDNAARRHVLAKWRFEPAVRDGRAVQAIGMVPVDFVLER